MFYVSSYSLDLMLYCLIAPFNDKKPDMIDKSSENNSNLNSERVKTS